HRYTVRALLMYWRACARDVASRTSETAANNVSASVSLSPTRWSASIVHSDVRRAFGHLKHPSRSRDHCPSVPSRDRTETSTNPACRKLLRADGVTSKRQTTVQRHRCGAGG